jgi:hypothetical protein
MFEEALTARLLAAEPLNDLIGNDFYWLTRPNAGGLPSITAQVTLPGTDYTHNGRSSLNYASVQFDCWGRTYAEAKFLSRALCFELDKMHSSQTVDFEDGIETRNMDMPVESLDGGSKVFRVLVEYSLPHTVKE